MGRTDAPRLSVIVASMRPGDKLPSAFRKLTRDGSASDVEVILVERLGAGIPDECAKPPNGALLRIGVADAATLPRLLGTALGHARGEVIAITDTRCEPDDGWVAALLRAHDSSDPVIGGAVEPGALRTLVDWAAYLTDYGQFMLPLTESPASELPGNNISIKRWALQYGREFAQEEFWKTYWCRQLQADGLQLRITPQLIVRYSCAYRLWPFLVRRFQHGRCFAGMRARQFRPIGRVAHIATAPALPGLLLARTVRAVVRKRRCLDKLALAMPIICLAMLSWSAGELTGYLCGPGASCRYVR